MIYLVSVNSELFEHSEYKIISKEESLEMMKDWNVIQFDTETSGKDPHLCDLLCAQFGNRAANAQIVVDCSCINTTKIYLNLSSLFFKMLNLICNFFIIIILYLVRFMIL